MVGKKAPLVTYSSGKRQVVGTAEVEGVPEGTKMDVIVEDMGDNVSSFTVDKPELIQE